MSKFIARVAFCKNMMMFIDDEANQGMMDLYGDEQEHASPIMDEFGNLIQEDLGKGGYDDDM